MHQNISPSTILHSSLKGSVQVASKSAKCEYDSFDFTLNIINDELYKRIRINNILYKYNK